MPNPLRNGTKLSEGFKKTFVERMTTACLYWFVRTLLQVMRIVWLKKVEGLKNLPKKGPYIIAANHCSQMDSLVVAMVMTSRIRIMAAEWLCQNLFFRFLIEGTGQIKVNSEKPRAAIKEACSELKAGGILCIFPEGKLSTDGNLGEFQGGTTLIAGLTGALVIPLYIGGTFKVWSVQRKWPDTKTGRVLTLRFGKSIKIEKGQDWCQATGIIKDAIAALGAPTNES
jgi:1-acyl-sn-glycerol-3-phosphate acyltransferase